MAKTPTIYVNDILAAIRRIETYTKNLTRAEFGRDELRQDAVIRCLEIVSEASRRVPDAFKTKHKEIPWAKIAGIGNILRHEYQSVSTDVIWDVTQTHLPELRRVALALKKELEKAKRRQHDMDM
ncbi:DUF86 domain-containing protein [Ferrovibrio sp. MS7]|uniref:HepT-like ribonuclease domain-containing protein n=1 Tax=Ferrovibrio plantarum TaxID=3119164 RepID=UPI0031352B0B